MSQLDDRLEAALSSRADTAEGRTLSPTAVRLAARRQQGRTRATAALAAALLLLPAGGFALGRPDHSARTTTQPSRPTPPGAVAALPWAGTTEITLRRGSAAGPRTGWSLCIGGACADVEAPGPHSLSLIDGATSVQGLAPLGTARVTVTTESDPPLEVAVAASGDSSPGVLFAAPDVSVSRPEGSAFSLTYRVTAYDATGAQLAVRTSVGGSDLAREHPPTGDVLVLDDPGPSAGPAQVAWADRHGWLCRGERAGSATAPTYGAYSCTPPTHPQDVALAVDSVGEDYVLLRVPLTISSVQVRDAGGRIAATASMYVLGEWGVAVIDRRATSSARGFTVTCLDASGGVVLTTPTNGLRPQDGTVVSR